MPNPLISMIALRFKFILLGVLLFGFTSVKSGPNSNCNGYLSLFLQFNLDTQNVGVDTYKFHSDDGCHYRLGESNANFRIKVFDLNNALLSTGEIYLSREMFVEKKDTKGKLQRGISSGKIYRLIKVSIKSPQNRMVKLKIYDLKSNKIMGETVLKLN